MICSACGTVHPAMPLLGDFRFFLANQSDLAARYRGRAIVIKGAVVIGDYDTVSQAVFEASRSHQLGTFLVQVAEAGPECYTQTFHSRVSFCHGPSLLPVAR